MLPGWNGRECGLVKDVGALLGACHAAGHLELRRGACKARVEGEVAAVVHDGRLLAAAAGPLAVLGLGLGAASLIGQKRFSVIREKDRYMAYSAADFGAGRHLEDVQERTFTEQMEEFMFLGLRMTDGVSEREFEERFGKKLEDQFGSVLCRHISQNLICRIPKDGGRLALTEYGMDVANYVMSDYLL